MSKNDKQKHLLECDVASCGGNCVIEVHEDEGVEIVWNNLSVETKRGKKLLKSISGRIEPGSMVALMGSSAAGKTTLLNALTGRMASDLKINGSLLVNGKERDVRTWNKVTAYVSQVFYAYENQTVEESLRFVYNAKNIRANVEHEIDDMLGLLGLTTSRKTMVSRLSGGERIRLSVGIELVGDPAVLFLDEPLSGLDSFNALNILKFLKTLTRQGKTLIMTIHQPSYEMTATFDKIYLMAQGNCVFEGLVDDCVTYFDELGFKLPVNTNLTDFFLNTTAINTCSAEKTEESLRRIEEMTLKWKGRNIDYSPKINIGLPLHYSSDNTKVGCGNLGRLLKRNLVDFWRNKLFFIVQLIMRIVTTTLFSFTYWQVGKGKTISIFTFRGLVSFLVINAIFAICSPIYNLFSLEQRIIKRERSSGYYSGFLIYFVKYTCELIGMLVLDIAYFTSIYFAMGFYVNFMAYVKFLAIMSSLSMCALAFGLTISIIAGAANIAQAIGASITILFILYSGTCNAPDDIPKWIRWMIYVSPLQYAFRALVQTQTENRNFSLDTEGIAPVERDVVVATFGMTEMNMSACIAVLTAFTVVFFVIGSTVLHYKTKDRLKIVK